MTILLLVGLISARAIADTPQEAEALSYVKAGRMLYDTGDYTAAIYSFQKARDRAPHKPIPYLWLARSLLRLGHCGEAAASVKEFILRVAPDDPRRMEIEKERDGCHPQAETKGATPAAAVGSPATEATTASPVPSNAPPATGKSAAPSLASDSQVSVPAVAKHSARLESRSTQKKAIIGGVAAGMVVVGVALGVGLGLGLSSENIPWTPLGPVDFR